MHRGALVHYPFGVEVSDQAGGRSKGDAPVFGVIRRWERDERWQSAARGRRESILLTRITLEAGHKRLCSS